MSYSGKHTSFVSVVESAFRDSGLDFIDYENSVEWTAELMGLIGTPHVYVEKVTDGIAGNPYGLKVENYRCKLPEDLESINSIRKIEADANGDATSYSEMIESSDIFHPTNVLPGDQYYGSSWNPLVNVDEFNPATEDFEHTRTEHELDAMSLPSGVQYAYKLDHGYIFTNFKDGYVQISYRGFPIDNNGFPLIPDDPKFKEALKYYIIYKIDWKNWRINPSPQNKSIVNDSEQKYLFYVGAARNKSHIPSVDKMEAIKNMWLRTNPKINEHKNGFKTLNVQEQRYNQSRRPIRNRRRY